MLNETKQQIEIIGRQLIETLPSSAYPLVIDVGHFVDLQKGPDASTVTTWEMGIALLDMLLEGKQKGEIYLSLLLNNLSISKESRTMAMTTLALPDMYVNVLHQYGFSVRYGMKERRYEKKQQETLRTITLEKNGRIIPLMLAWEGKLKNRGKRLLEVHGKHGCIIKTSVSECFAASRDGVPYIKLMLPQSKPMCSLIMGTHFQQLVDQGVQTILCLYHPRWTQAVNRGVVVFDHLFRDLNIVPNAARIISLQHLVQNPLFVNGKVLEPVGQRICDS